MRLYNYILIVLIPVALFVSELMYSSQLQDLMYCSIAGIIGVLIPYVDTVFYNFRYEYTHTTKYLEDVASGKQKHSPLPAEIKNQGGFFHSWYAFIIFVAIYFVGASYGERMIDTITGFDIRPWFWMLGISFTLGYALTLITDIFTEKGVTVFLFDRNHRIKSPFPIPNNLIIQLIIFVVLFVIYIIILSKTFVYDEVNDGGYLQAFFDFIKTTWNLLTTGHR